MRGGISFLLPHGRAGRAGRPHLPPPLFWKLTPLWELLPTTGRGCQILYYSSIWQPARDQFQLHRWYINHLQHQQGLGHAAEI